MSIGWGSLPLLPLRCVMDHLSMKDALSAMSVSRHWRGTMLLYEGHKDKLELRAKNMEKNMFLTRMFRKHIKQLHIYLDCNGEELENFMNYVLPQFLDTVKLEEVLFIGPGYIQHNQNLPFVKLKRIITESLVFKHLHCLHKLVMIGCEIDTAKNEKERYTDTNVEYYSRALSFDGAPSPADAVLSSSNIGHGHMEFSSLRHIIIEYDKINTEALVTLSHLPRFSQLTLNIYNKRQLVLAPLDWPRLSSCWVSGLDVAVVIINLPYRKLNEVIENVLVEGFTLISLKVLFCKTLFTPLITHVVRLYKATLRELVWADTPYDSREDYHRVIRPVRHQEYEMCNVNPFVLLCWQCEQLRRLVIHGYWIWQYDILGFVRLRRSLRDMQISAIFNNPGRFSGSFQATTDNIVRVLAVDTPKAVPRLYVKQVNEFIDFQWSPVPWSKLHRGLRARSTAEQRADYILQETNTSMLYSQ